MTTIDQDQVNDAAAPQAKMDIDGAVRKIRVECESARHKAWQANKKGQWAKMHRENGRAVGLARALEVLGYKS